MNKIIAFSVSFFILISCSNDTKIDYPITKKIKVIDTYFDTEVNDPYRWMEDDQSQKVKDWIENQNQLTFDYLDKISYREILRKRLEKLWDYEKIGTPFEEGDYTYFYKNDGLQNQSVLYRKKGDDQEDVFINPNNFSDVPSSTMYLNEDWGVV